MVVNKAYESERLGYSVEGVSSFCNRVTQSPRAMSDTTDTRGQRKYRNAAYPNYPNDPNISAGLPDSMNTRRQVAEGHGELSPRVDSEGSSTLGVKKKGLQKIASGAIANIGSVFKGGAVEQLEGRVDSTQAKAYRANKNSANTDAHDVIPHSDPGTQEKLSQKERFFQKAWRNRPKVIPNAGNSLWVPEADCFWSSVEGNRIQLTNTEVSTLSEPEYIALQKIAQARLRQLDFRSHVIIPKDSRSTRKSLKRALSWKSKGSGSLEKDKDSGVFAIPLHKAVLAQGSSDQTDSKKVQKNPKSSTPPSPSTPSASTLAAPYEEPKVRRHSSSSLPQSPRSPTITVDDSSEDSTTDNKEETNKDTPVESASWKSRLIDALTLLSSSASASCLIDKEAALNPTPLQVPSIVLQAVEHLQSYGLHVLGIFRAGGAKKRTKQMRDEFDSGEKKRFTAEDNPHDVAALFKEYFRDLPEPLLTRDLYSAFLETQTFENESMQITALRLLCCLLPVPNRDTLKVLLDFLAEVASFAEDKLDEKGVEIPGNKMTSRNLAIIIGPNILHKVKGQHYDFLVEDKARADERKEVIDVVQDMIEHHKELFEISAEMHHEALIQLLESEPEVVDYILKRIMPANGSRVGMEDNVFAVEGVDDEQTPTRGRVRSAGAAERPLARISSAPGSHLPTDSNWRARQHTVTRSGSDKGTYSPMISTRSQSSSQDEGRHYRDQYFNRQLSSPDDSLSPATYNYRQNKRKTPPLMRSACRYDGSASSEPPPSPALSSRSPSVSWSNYSTPPSSPSGSAAFASADSNSSSPITGRAFIADESSTIAELTSLLTEVEVELTHEGGDYARRVQVDKETFTVPDWQLENWLQWETLTRQNSSQKDFLEQETLV